MSELNEELLERLGGFWQSYKFYITVSVLMALSAATGLSCQSSSHDAARRETGGALFALLRAGEEGDAEAAQLAFEKIDGERFPSLRNLARASLAAAQNKAGAAENAENALREAVKTETESGLRTVMILRLAEVLINSEKYEEALKHLTESEPEEEMFRMLFAERRGDAHFAAGANREALAEYEKAGEYAARAFTGYAPLLRIKIGAASSLPSEGADNAETGGAN